MKQMPWWNTYFLKGFLPMVLVTTVCCWLSCWRLLALVTTVDEAALGGGIVTGPVPGMGADCPEWLWVVWCFFNSRRSRYPLEQTAHTKGFSPVWIRTCVTYLSRLKNPLPQVSHLKKKEDTHMKKAVRILIVYKQKISSIHIQSTILNIDKSYLYGKSPVWRREWRLSSLRSRKLFSHMVHKYGRSPKKKFRKNIIYINQFLG